jgi:hypothetical protein
MLIPAVDGEQSAAQVCEPNQAHPSEWTPTPRHTPPREHDRQRVASCHCGPVTGWGRTECHCQHGAYRHVRIAIFQSLSIFRLWVTPVSWNESCQGGSSSQRPYHLTHVLLAASRKSFPNRSVLGMGFTLARRWFPLYAFSCGPWYVYL